MLLLSLPLFPPCSCCSCCCCRWGICGIPEHRDVGIGTVYTSEWEWRALKTVSLRSNVGDFESQAVFARPGLRKKSTRRWFSTSGVCYSSRHSALRSANIRVFSCSFVHTEAQDWYTTCEQNQRIHEHVRDVHAWHTVCIQCPFLVYLGVGFNFHTYFDNCVASSLNYNVP